MNIRFSEDAHNTLKTFCKERGFNLGRFCEIAALDRMTNEYGIIPNFKEPVEIKETLFHNVNEPGVTERVRKVLKEQQKEVYSNDTRFKIVNGKKVFK